MVPPGDMRTILILSIAGTLVAGCDAGDPDDGRIAVVTSFYPLQYAAERTGGGCVVVTNLTPPGVEPHDLELTPDGVEAIAKADLVVYIGGGFQPAVEDALGEARGRTVDVLDGVSTIPAQPGEEELAVDPHVWLDPARFQTIVATIGDALERVGIECDLGAGERDLADELADLDRVYRSGLADCRQDILVTSHAAFGYLADAFDLRQEAIAGLEPESEPDARRMAELKHLVEREGISVVFTEELVAPDVAETLASEAGVEARVLYTIEGLTDEQAAAGGDYVSLMEENLDALRDALGCA
jgi:zinc transport system substrate-binding protein